MESKRNERKGKERNEMYGTLLRVCWILNMESIGLISSQNIIENRKVKKNPEMKYDKTSNTTMDLVSALGTICNVQCTMAMCVACETQKLQ